MQDQVAELEARNEKYAAVLAAFKEQVADLQSEIVALKNENATLRSLITGADEAPKAVSPTEFLAQVAHEQVDKAPADPQISIAEAAPEVVAEVPVAEEKPKGKSRSRVGSMFDLLSFNEI